MNVKTFLASLTLEEKIGQLAQLAPFFFIKDLTNEVAGPLKRLNISEKDVFLAGSVLGIGNPEEMMQVQQAYLAKSRHKIPLLFMADIIHGYKTIFPIPLALAGSFSAQNFMDMARMSAKEATLSGIHVTFSPMADLVRDFRWGRVMESLGEDPLLAYDFAYAMTQGYQGKRLSSKDSLAACVKHFAGYGAPLGGRDYNPATISLHDFYQYYQHGYQGAIDAGARLVMTSFNVFEGIPATIHQHLLKKILRKHMRFKGVTISDYDSLIETIVHRVTQDEKEAARKGIEATLDIEMASAAYLKHLATLVHEGQVDMKLIDDACLRVLKLKKDLGLFKNPFKGADVNKEKTFPLSKEPLALAKKLADESIVLLKNDQHILPLQANQSIALLGKMSNTGSLLGPWSWHGSRQDTQTVLQAFGSAISFHTAEEDYQLWSQDQQRQIENYDTVVLVSGEEEKESGEARSKVNPTLADSTIHLIKKLKSLHKKIILVVTAGRPLVLTPIIDEVDALVYAYFLGTCTAQTIADTLLGINNPSAKLAMSFPRHLGQTPIMYNRLETGRPFLGQSFTYTSHYIDESNEPLFTFADGLSYTQFQYDHVTINRVEEGFRIDWTLANIGQRAGTEISQVYLSIAFADVALPRFQLVGYTRTTLQAQASTSCSMLIPNKALTYVDGNFDKKIAQGKVTFSLGGNLHALHAMDVML